MEWLAENAHNGYFLLGFAAFMLAGVWWIQKQVIYLAGAGIALVLLLVFWLVIRNVPTTAAKIEADLKALAQALLAKDQAKAFHFVSDELKYRAKGREKWYAHLEELLADYKIDAIDVRQFDLKTHAHAEKEASVDFQLEAKHQGKVVFSAECPWKMTLAGDTWQVHKVQMRKAISKGGKDVSVESD